MFYFHCLLTQSVGSLDCLILRNAHRCHCLLLNILRVESSSLQGWLVAAAAAEVADVVEVAAGVAIVHVAVHDFSLEMLFDA
jgi:hypothetical protein